ncbi:hypothetical protein TNCT_714501 [Trichonephila clavata]|uniref:Uncharacterized protein n=1 Tax=Trichonephila clavata TaxID=2740835 RepID=A0A8X6HT85_TRICU|nr:hypothetical protein TNCT_714501 [Trichonephila clavata]
MYEKNIPLSNVFLFLFVNPSALFLKENSSHGLCKKALSMSNYVHADFQLPESACYRAYQGSAEPTPIPQFS